MHLVFYKKLKNKHFEMYIINNKQSHKRNKVN